MKVLPQSILGEQPIPGAITIKATSPKLKAGSLKLSSVTYNSNEIEKAAKAIYDYPIHRIDIGSEKQFVEFDWKAWALKDANTITYTTDDNITFSLSADSTIAWTEGEPVMMGNLSFMGADGAYVFKQPVTTFHYRAYTRNVCSGNFSPCQGA